MIYLEIHSLYIFKAISRTFSWSILKFFEPRNCFWDSVLIHFRDKALCLESEKQFLLKPFLHIFF